MRDRQRHDLRPLGLDLDPRRRQGAAGRPGARDRRDLDQLEQLGAGDDAVRRLQAVGRRAASSAPTRSSTTPRSRTSSTRQGELMAGRLEGKVCVITGSGQRDRRRVGAAVRRARARASSASTSAPASSGDADDRGRRHRREPGRRAVRARRATSSAASTCSSTTPASTRPTTPRSSRPARGLAAGPGRQRARRLPLLQARHPPPARQRAGGGSVINTASFVAMMGAAVSQISYTASKGAVLAMSRELGVEFARRGVRVNALCPGPDQHAAAAGAVRQGSRARPRAGSSICPMGRFGEPDEIAKARRLPRLRRVLLHHRHDLHGRRRALRRLPDAGHGRVAPSGEPAVAAVRLSFDADNPTRLAWCWGIR